MTTRTFLLGAASAGIIAATSFPAFAQTQPDNPDGFNPARDEVVTTARKREENLQDVPLSIGIFTNAAIERKGITEIDDVANLTPGLNFDVGLVPSDTRISIRGLQAVRGRPNVAILIDGIDSSSENFGVAGGGALANLRLVDVEQIEVVKGPQNVLYGRSAFAGAVNYITKKASNEQEINLSAEAGSFGMHQIKGSIAGPLVEDKLFARANAAYYKTNGDYDNVNTNSNLNAGETIGGALAVTYEASPNFTANLRAQYSEEKYSPTAKVLVRSADPLTGFANAADGGVILPDMRPGAPFPIGIYTIQGDLSESASYQNRDFDQSGDPNNGGQAYKGTEIDTFRATLNLEWEQDFGTFTSLTGYTDSSSSFNEDFDHTNFELLPNTGLPAYEIGGPFSTLSIFQGPPFFWPLPFLPAYGLSGEFDSGTEVKQFSQELRFAKEWDKARLLIDGLYWHEEAKYRESSLFWLREGGNQTLAAFTSFGFNPPPNGFGFHLLSPPVTSPNPQNITRETDSYSIAASLEYDITDRLSATIEGRYIDDKIVYTGFDFDPFPVNTFGAPTGGFTQTDPPVTASEFTPRLGLSWKATDDVLIFGSYARGTKPGGVDTTDQNGNVNDGRFLPESVDTYELGAKVTAADGRLILNGALFSNTYTDQQIGLVETINGIPQSRTVNAGESKSKGFEAELNWSPIDELFLRASYTYVDSEFTDYILPSCGPTASAETGTPDCDFTGHKVPQTPENQLNLSARYESNLENGGMIWGEIDGRYESKRFMSTSNLAWLPSYWQADARIGYDAGKWAITGYVDNLFEDDTPRTGTSSVDYGYFDLTAFQLPRGYLIAAPRKRAFGVRLDVDF